MAWIILMASGAFEAVWAIALSKTEGFTKLWPTVVFILALIISMGGLAYAMRTLPLGTSYAVWVSVGAVLTIAFSFLTGAEPVTFLRLLFLAMIIGGVVGLKMLPH